MPGAVSRLVRPILLGCLAVVAAGCQLRTEVNVTVEDDGSGVVEVGLGLDEEGVEENPDLLETLDFDDLIDAGWEVTAPTEEDDGFTWVRVRHRFSRPEQVAPLVDQIAGGNGPFRDFAVGRDDGFAETTYRFDGVVDFSAGVEDLASDPELAEALGDEPLDLIEQRLGRTVDQFIRFQVGVRLPGDVTSNAPTQARNGAVWRPSVLEREPIELSASSTISRTERVVWSAVGVVAGIALVLFVLIRMVAWRRSRVVARGS